IRKDQKFISKTFINKSDALKWAKEQEVKIEQGNFTVKKEVVTLVYLLERWEKEVLVHLKSWSVELYKVAVIPKNLVISHLIRLQAAC
ncbi:MAG: hypothetical protein RL563_371, partial [Pseudomonadota bacterium]